MVIILYGWNLVYVYLYVEVVNNIELEFVFILVFDMVDLIV